MFNEGVFDPVKSIEHFDGIYVLDFEEFTDISGSFKSYEEAGHLYDVGVTGLKDNKGVGSKRFCTHDLGLSRLIDHALKSAGILQYYNDGMYAGCSQYWRFMRYRAGGEHFPHYDGDFRWILPNGSICKTTHSVVCYFSDCTTGEFAFVRGDKALEDEMRVKGVYAGDWDRQANESEIIKKVKPRNGRVLIFPHDRLHTVLPFTESHDRIIARGDLIFKEK